MTLLQKTSLPENDRVVRPHNVTEPIPVPAGILRSGGITIAVGASALMLWAGLAPLSGAVVAEGVVKADGNRRTVQHQEGGIIKQILVKDGDQVKAGQALMTLDDVRTDANFSSLTTQVEAQRAKAARLTAERDFAPQPDFSTLTSQGQVANVTPHVAELIQRETGLFVARRHVLENQISLIKRQITEVDQEVSSLATSTKTSKEGETLAEDESKLYQKLKDQGFISEAKLMEYRRTHTDYRVRTESQVTELAKATQKRTELELKIATLKNDYTKTATDELKDTSSQLFKMEEELRPLADQQVRETIVAPLAGEIVDLKFHSNGAVIGPREPIMDVVPNNIPLVIEAKIKPENIKDIQVNSAADIKLTAYKQRSTPIIVGKVIYLGADRLTDKMTNQPYYLAHINVSASALRQANKLAEQPIDLLQGMQAEVYIKTQERTAFDYLMEPLTSGLRRSMRER